MRPRGTTKQGPKHLDSTQLRKFFNAVKSARKPRDTAMLSLCFSLGLRVSEVCRLRLSDLNQSSRQLFITASKNGTSRTHDVDAKLWLKIQRWLKIRSEKYEDNPYLFPSRTYTLEPINPQSVKYLFKRYAKLADLSPDFSIHSLRHSLGYMMAESGSHPQDIKLMLRHRCLSSSEIYFQFARIKQADKAAGAVSSQVL